MNIGSWKRHSDTLTAFALAVGVFFVYLRTLCPTLYWGDCGEMALTAATLGIPHPTGYPLYCLLGKAWTLLLPFGTVVWRMNVLSAVFGSLAIACLYGAGRACRLPKPVALASAGLLAFSSTFWQQALITETYTLAALFTCLLLLLAARWNANGRRASDLRLLALAYGFTLTSHQTNTLFLPGFVLFVLWSEPRLRRLADRAVRREWLQTLGLGALPLLTYLYLPLRARTHPVYNWGDPETLSAFYYHVTARIFAPLMFQPHPADILNRLHVWAVNLPLEFAWPLLTLAVLGLVCFWRQPESRPLALMLTWIFCMDVVFVVNYAIYNGYIYFIPCYIVLSLCIGRGLLGVWSALEPRLASGGRPALSALAAACAVALIPVQGWQHRAVDLSGNWTCEDYGRNLLASVPPHGILIENGDDTASSVVLYLQNVERVRPDVILIRRGLLAGIFDPNSQTWANFWYLDSVKRVYPRVRSFYPPPGLSVAQAMTEDPLRRIIRDAVARGVPVCAVAPQGPPDWVCQVPPFTDDDGTHLGLGTYLDRHYSPVMVGLVTRVYGRGYRPADAVLASETERVWRGYSLRGVYTGQLERDPYEVSLALNYAHGSLARADEAFARKDYRTAAASYADVLTLFGSRDAAQGLQRCRAVSQTAAGSP